MGPFEAVRKAKFWGVMQDGAHTYYDNNPL